ncbi:hypothetical protein E6P78_27255 [Streptomyces sp. A0958]|uniref:DUF6274 family protein n=1 Tax=Streptomyces sp. A0958 TaxID=2563101 RepID=UPI00109E3B70|nr:DUF6274 family protein [Streptomyces sp. A0958]THA60386.1 hypothetical protein E6P78_27255 [Streptomyces sp. A0958]
MRASADEGYREPAQGPGRAPRHKVRALLRAHLAAASGYRHLTRHCAVCARLLRLAMEPVAASRPTRAADEPSGAPDAPTERRRAAVRASRAGDVSPPTT